MGVREPKPDLRLTPPVGVEHVLLDFHHTDKTPLSRLLYPFTGIGGLDISVSRGLLCVCVSSSLPPISLWLWPVPDPDTLCCCFLLLSSVSLSPILLLLSPRNTPSRDCSSTAEDL